MRKASNSNNAVPFGQNLTPGSWYRITEIDPHDPNPSMNRGAILLCATERAGCIDPENHEDDGMGTQWFADFGPIGDGDDEPAYRTLVNGVELVAVPTQTPTDGETESK